jgi:pimeloyl-ACP methyl ester carboxylesterase
VGKDGPVYRRALCLFLALAIPCGLVYTTPLVAVAQGSAASAPAFEAAPCVYPLPSDQQEGKTVHCGFVTVPERHANPNGKTIRLPVFVYKALNPNPAPDPIVMLAGGPGQSGQVYTLLLTGARYQALAAQHDLIVFDQRGTGKAEPALTCPELSAAGAFADRLIVQALGLKM